jgi:hypothetical protein
MSRLSEAIRRTQRTDAQPIGFGAQRTAPRPSMLVALVAAGRAALDAARESGADVLIVDRRATGVPSESEVSAARAAAGEAPLGLWLGETPFEAPEALRKAGADFIVGGADSLPASVLLEEELGLVLEATPEAEEQALRLLAGLHLDAVYVDAAPHALTVARQLALGRVGLLSQRPLILAARPGLAGRELEVLRSAGVAVLATTEPGAVAGLKEAVLALPPRKPRRSERPAVALPRVQPEEDEED